MTTETKTVTYIAECPNQILVLDPGDQEKNYRGQVIRQLPRAVVEFAEHRASIGERNGKATCNGKVLPTTFVELVERLEGSEENGLPHHDLFGITRGFWRDGDAPGEPRPTLDELREEIASADHAELREIKAREIESHNRPAALALITDAALAPEAPGEAEKPRRLRRGDAESGDGDPSDV